MPKDHKSKQFSRRQHPYNGSLLPSDASHFNVKTKNSTQRPLRAVEFVRVSTPHQGMSDHLSLQTQKEAIKNWASENNVKIIKKYQVIGSGRSMSNHENYNSMMDYVKTKKNNVKYVIVYCIDRFGRNALESTHDLFELLQHDVSLISVDEGLNINKERCPDTYAFMYKSIFADQESTKIEERVRGAQAYMKSLGAKFGKCPYGFHEEHQMVPREGTTDYKIRVFVPDLDESKMLSEISQLEEHDMKKYIRDKSFRGEPLTLQKCAQLKRYVVKNM